MTKIIVNKYVTTEILANGMKKTTKITVEEEVPYTVEEELHYARCCREEERSLFGLVDRLFSCLG